MMPAKGMKFDVGPNFYAGRLVAKCVHKYYYIMMEDTQHKCFKVEQATASATVDQAKAVLDTFEMNVVYEWPRVTLGHS